MGIVDLGRRVELLSMDPRFHDISVGLYEGPGDGARVFTVHSYSRLPGAGGRVAGIAAAMRSLGGMAAADAPGAVRFRCGAGHRLAVKRLFLDACKVPEDEAVPRPMTVDDRKSGQTIRAEGTGGGGYRVAGDGGERRRALAVARGLARLAEMEQAEGRDDEVRFPCGHAHDPLVGLLMVRALNLRAVMRELEAQAARGVLAAPSARN